MNEVPLLIALLVAGAGVLAFVWGYHRWRLYRWAPRRSEAPVDEAADHEPPRLEPVLEMPVAPATVPDSAQSALSDHIDALVELKLERPVSGDAILAVLPPSRRVGSKPFGVEGIPSDATVQAWEAPRAGQHYARLRVGIQLANRSGALNEIEYSEFVQKVSQMADHLLAAVDFPDMLAVVRRARELDQFAAAHDAQLVLTLRAQRAAWSPGYVTQHALRIGFVRGALPGRMVYAAEDGTAMVALQFETQAALADDPELSVLREIKLRLDVPHVAQDLNPFEKLRSLSQSLAAAMDGWVGDEKGQPLGETELDAIAHQLQTLYQKLHEQGLPAGSLEARRLFS